MTPTGGEPDPELRARLDRQLVDLVRAGDARSARLLFERIDAAVLRTLHKVLGRADHEYEDVYQLALEKIVQSIYRGQYEGRCNLGTWAGVVTSRVAIDHLRRRKHERRIFWRRRTDEPDDIFDMGVSETRPDDEVEQQKKQKALRLALAKISPDKAQTVVLYEVMGHELGEIADIMGVSVAAAQSRLVRGRKELAALLGHELLGERR